MINTRAAQSLQIGNQDIDEYLLKLVKEDNNICSQLDSIAESEMISDKDELYREFCIALKESGLCELDIIPINNAEDVDFVFKNQTVSFYIYIYILYNNIYMYIFSY